MFRQSVKVTRYGVDNFCCYRCLCLIVYFIVYISLPHHFSGAIYKIAPSHASAVKSDPIFLPSTSKQCPCMCGVSAASKMRSCS